MVQTGRHNYLVKHEKYSNLTKADYEAIADPSWPSFETFSNHESVPGHIYEEIDQMLDLETFDHPSFCILPFRGIEYPSGKFCCLVSPGTDREYIKTQILAGERAQECSACWRMEDLGQRSDRLIKNETFDFYHHMSVKDLLEQARSKPATQLNCVKFDSDNTCNATCVTCDPNSSSAWGNLLRTAEQPRIWNIKQQEFDYAGCKTLMFRGGEPFLSKNNFAILERLLSLGNDSCVVSFVTNGSIWPSESQLATMLKFKNLVISFSIDGVGPVFEYLRYPLAWSTVADNLRKWKQLGVELGVSYTLSNINLLYHDQTRQWFHDQHVPFLINPVQSPEWFAMNSLSASIKQFIGNRIQDPAVRQMLREHDAMDDIRFDRFRQEIAKQDQLKKISIKDYLPEFSELIKW